MKSILSSLTLTSLFIAAHLQAQDIFYQETFEVGGFGPAAGWYGYWNTDAQGGISTGSYRESITFGASYAGAGNYLYAQTQIGDAMNYFLFDRDSSISIKPDDHTELNAIWDRSGNFAPRFAVLVGTQWYVTDTTFSPSGTSPVDLKTATWTELTLDPGNTLALGTSGLTYANVFAGEKTISSIGFYVNASATTSNVTTRINNVEIYNSDVSSYTWQGNSGTGGTGNWDSVRTTEWGGLWRSHRTAIFGGANDAGTGGTVSLQMGTGAAGLRFESKANNYTLQGSGATRTLTLTGDIYVHSDANVTFGNNFITTRSNDHLNITGGGTLNLNNGSTLRTTSTSGARYIAILGGTTVRVNTGAELTAQSSLIIGSTITSGISGDGTLIVDGGIVNTQTNGNFILGNRDNQIGDVEVTIISGEINVSGVANNGLVFENKGASSAWFNLNGGIVTTGRVHRNGAAPATGESSHFNFNGGVLRVDELGAGSDADNANYAFLTNTSSISYRVLEGGAIIDTNGRNIRIVAPLVSAATNDGGFTKRGEGILQLHGNNTYNGRTVIEEGVLSINNDNNLGATQTGTNYDDGIVIHDAATLRVTDTVNVDASNRTLAIGDPDNAAGGGTATIEVTDDNTFTYSLGITQLTSDSSLSKTGSGDLRIAGYSDYTGKTSVEEGSLTLLNVGFGGGWLDSTWIDVADGAEFDVSDFAIDGYTYYTNTLSGSGTIRGNTFVDNNLDIKIGNTSSGHQGLTNLADAGDLTGILTFDGDFSSGNSTIHYQLGGTTQGSEYDHLNIIGEFDPNADTTFKVTWANDFVAAYLDEFDLINWLSLSDPDWDGFNINTNLDLDDTLADLMAAGLYWDTSDFLNQGVIRVVPEPSRVLLLTLAVACITLRRRRSNQ